MSSMLTVMNELMLVGVYIFRTLTFFYKKVYMLNVHTNRPTRTAQSSFPYRIRPTVHLIFLFSCPCGAHRFVSALPDSSPTTPCPASSDEPGGDDRSAAQSAAGTREKRRYSLFSATAVAASRPCSLAFSPSLPRPGQA